MNPNCIYEVKTYWGYFRLDEGAYEDYLKGMLWITWVPGKPKTELASGAERLTNISEEAVVLRDEAEKSDAYTMICRLCSGEKIQLPYKSKMKDISIDEMSLSVRASNGLMRAGAKTLGKVAELVALPNGLKSIRNLGTKSEKEILRSFVELCYEKLNYREKLEFWQRAIANSSPHDWQPLSDI